MGFPRRIFPRSGHFHIGILVAGMVLAGSGCSKEEPLPQRNVVPLGDSLAEWTSSLEGVETTESLDGMWTPAGANGRGGTDVYRASLPGGLAPGWDVSEAGASLHDQRMEARRFNGTGSVEPGVLCFQPGLDLWTGTRTALYEKGTIECEANLVEGPVGITILAKGDLLGGVGPNMVPVLNGTALGSIFVNSTEKYAEYTVWGAATEGKNRIEIHYVNDGWRPPEDRNLYIQNVKVLQPAGVYCLGDGEGPPKGIEVTYKRQSPLVDVYHRVVPPIKVSSNTGPWRYHEIGDETMRSIPLPPPGELRVEFDTDEAATLRVSYSVVSATGEVEGAPPVTFEAWIGEGEGRRLLDSVTIPSEEVGAGRWVHRKYDLEGGPSQGWTLDLLTRPAEDDGEAVEAGPLAFISEPLLVSPGRDPRGMPNVVVVSLDTLRADHVGCYGYEVPTSPNLDEFARENIRFETVMAPSSWTLPSHMSLFSSLNPSAHGVLAMDQANRAVRMLAELLEKEGYLTKGIADGAMMSAEYGFCAGFRSYSDHGQRGFETILPEAESWLREEAVEPYFLFVHTYDIHDPYMPPKRFRDRMTPPGGVSPELLDGVPGQFVKTAMTNPGGLKRADLAQMINMYDACIMFADESVGRIFDALKARGDWDNTLLVVTSDHGEEFLEHGNIWHWNNLYEESIRVPLLVRAPGVASGVTVPGVVRLIDVAPTVLDYLAFDPPESFQGRSLFECVEEPGESRVGYAEMEHLVARREEDEKFIWNTEKKRAEFYDLGKDPGESENLAENRPGGVRKMKGEVERYRKKNEKIRDDYERVQMEFSQELAEELQALGYMK